MASSPGAVSRCRDLLTDFCASGKAEKRKEKGTKHTQHQEQATPADANRKPDMQKTSSIEGDALSKMLAAVHVPRIKTPVATAVQEEQNQANENSRTVKGHAVSTPSTPSGTTRKKTRDDDEEQEQENRTSDAWIHGVIPAKHLLILPAGIPVVKVGMAVSHVGPLVTFQENAPRGKAALPAEPLGIGLASVLTKEGFAPRVVPQSQAKAQTRPAAGQKEVQSVHATAVVKWGTMRPSARGGREEAPGAAAASYAPKSGIFRGTAPPGAWVPPLPPKGVMRTHRHQRTQARGGTAARLIV
ncbi:hypothetical protein Pelo_7807 [Pelomyxa schiedti]|nr:hypothetical protein Pelo_7807 [Pelomyxa schiedti]